MLRLSRLTSLYWPVLIFLFLFSGWRYEVGCDWSGYIRQYNIYSQMTLSELNWLDEPLWKMMFIFQDRLGLPYPWINVFSSAVFFAGMHAMARRQPDRLAFLILLFPILIINMPMSGIRQATAIGVLGFAFVAFTDRSLLRFVVFVLLSSAFHTSSLIFLALAPLVSGSFSRKRILISILVAIPGMAILASSALADIAVSRYVNTGVDSAGALYRVAFLSLTGGLFFVVLNSSWRDTYPRDHKLAAIGSLAMMFLLALLPFSSVIADRLAYGIMPIQAVIFARIVKLPRVKNRNLYIFGAYASLLLILVSWTSLSWIFDICYIPYNTWIFDGSRYISESY